MAGLGKYKKGAKFTLKSGNNPAFKVMGSSPAKIPGMGARITGTQEKGEFVPKGIDYRPGKYEKEEDSPNNLNNFGIGPGGSPWKQDDDDDDKNGNGNGKNEEKVRRTGGDIKPGKEAKVGEKKEPGWVKRMKIATTLLSGGIQGVYGGTREVPKINWGKWTQEELDESAASKIKKDITGDESFKDVYNPQKEDGTFKTVEEYNTEYDEFKKKQGQEEETGTKLSGGLQKYLDSSRFLTKDYKKPKTNIKGSLQ